MSSLRVGRHVLARSSAFHPAWLLAPVGLLACLALGLVLGTTDSLTAPLLLGGAALALLWLALVMLRPEWALLIYAFSAVNLNGVDLPFALGSLRLSPDIVLTSLLIVGTLLRLLQTKRPLSRLRITAPYLVFMAVPFLTLIWSPVPVQSLKGSFRFVGYYAVMWLIVDTIQSRQQIMRMVGAIMLSPIVPILVGIYQMVTGGGQIIWAGQVYNRVYALAGGPFTLAYYLVLILPLLVVFFLADSSASRDSFRPLPRRRSAEAEHNALMGSSTFQGNSPEQDGLGQHRRFALMLLIGGSLVALLSTFIRGSWMALTVALIVLGALHYRRLLVIIPAAAVALLWAYAPAQSRLVQTADPTSTLFGRMRLWAFAWEWIQTSPLVGVGMKAFEFYYILLAGPIASGGLNRREQFLVGNRPHNEIIGFLLDVGLIGTVALVIVLAMVIRTALRIWRQSADDYLGLVALAFVTSSVGMLVGAMGDNVFSQPTVAVYFWIMAGLILAIDRHLIPPDSASRFVSSSDRVSDG